MSRASDTARRREIVRQLSDMSRGGWRNARPTDYLPLEQELRELDQRLRKKIPRKDQKKIDRAKNAGFDVKHLKK